MEVSIQDLVRIYEDYRGGRYKRGQLSGRTKLGSRLKCTLLKLVGEFDREAPIENSRSYLQYRETKLNSKHQADPEFARALARVYLFSSPSLHMYDACSRFSNQFGQALISEKLVFDVFDDSSQRVRNVEIPFDYFIKSYDSEYLFLCASIFGAVGASVLGEMSFTIEKVISSILLTEAEKNIGYLVLLNSIADSRLRQNSREENWEPNYRLREPNGDLSESLTHSIYKSRLRVIGDIASKEFDTSETSDRRWHLIRHFITAGPTSQLIPRHPEACQHLDFDVFKSGMANIPNRLNQPKYSPNHPSRSVKYFEWLERGIKPLDYLYSFDRPTDDLVSLKLKSMRKSFEDMCR